MEQYQNSNGSPNEQLSAENYSDHTETWKQPI